MVMGLFGDFSYEKALVKRGLMKLPKKGGKKTRLPHEGRETDDAAPEEDDATSKGKQTYEPGNGRYSDGRYIDKNDPRRFEDSRYIDKDGQIRGGYDDPIRAPPADVGARDARKLPSLGYDGARLESIGEPPW